MNYKHKLLYIIGICVCMTLFGMVYAMFIESNPVIMMTSIWGIFAGFFFNEYINNNNDDERY